MGNDTKVLLEKKEKKERTGTREESAQRTLRAFTKLWWNLNIVSSVTKQANTFLCRGCAIANIVWFGLSFIISYRRATVTPTLHPLLLSSNRFFKFIYLHSLSISFSRGTQDAFQEPWSTSYCLKQRFHSLQTQDLRKVSINIWTRSPHQHCLDLMYRGFEMPTLTWMPTLSMQRLYTSRWAFRAMLYKGKKTKKNTEEFT